MATAVTLVAVVGLIQAVTIGAEMLDVSRKQTIAMQIIRNEIEGVHLKDWATVSTFPNSASITVNNQGTGLAWCFTTNPNIVNPTAEKAFALTNYTNSYTPPYPTTPNPPANDDNTNLLSAARNFTLSLSVTNITGRSNFLVLTYTVTWTSGNRRKVLTRTGTTYYGKNGLNLYYRR